MKIGSAEYYEYLASIGIKPKNTNSADNTGSSGSSGSAGSTHKGSATGSFDSAGSAGSTGSTASTGSTEGQTYVYKMMGLSITLSVKPGETEMQAVDRVINSLSSKLESLKETFLESYNAGKKKKEKADSYESIDELLRISHNGQAVRIINKHEQMLNNYILLKNSITKEGE